MSGHEQADDRRVVVVLGAGIGGQAMVAAAAADAHVIVVDRTAEYTDPVTERVQAAGGSAESVAMDLTNLDATIALADDLLTRHGRIDAVVHLVGGWRGSSTVDSEAIEQWRQLVPGIVGTVQTTSVAFRDALIASPCGRYVMVTSTAVHEPKQSNAAYASTKAAAAAWVAALGDSFRGTPAAAVIVEVMALVSPATREANPGKEYANFTDTPNLAAAIMKCLDDADLDPCTTIDLTRQS